MIRFSRIAILGLFAALALALPALAQKGGAFAPRLIVNDRAITNWELDQRIAFMRLLGSSGNIAPEALDALIDDRLQLDAAADLGIRLDEQVIRDGMSEFAARADLTAEAFVAELAKAGVAEQTFRDFVEAGLAWREVVRTRFGPRAQISDAEIDRAAALTVPGGGARVLLSEIILRADTPEFAAQANALAEQLSRQIKGTAAFAEAAQQYSVSGSRAASGRIDWVDLSVLPPNLAAQVLTLPPGGVTEPVSLPNAVGLFQLRAIEETGARAQQPLAVDYARLSLPGADAGQAQAIIARSDTCDDLYGAARALPPERLQRQTVLPSQIPQDVALDLARLDDNEAAVQTIPGGVAIVMVCGRTASLDTAPNRDEIRMRLQNQRLTSYADGYLATLRADAIIREP